jgi:hypothetical protein
MSCLCLARYNASNAGVRLKDFDDRISVEAAFCFRVSSCVLCDSVSLCVKS